MLKLKNPHFIILAISLVISFLLAETVLRLSNVKPINILSCRRPDKIYHHGFVPSSNCRFKTEEWDVDYHINQFGLRDEEFDFEKPEGNKRILLLGDSFTEGYGVNEKESYAYRIELELLGQFNNTFKMINAGISGRSPLMNYLYLKDEGILFEPDLVVYIFDLTDFYDDFISYQQALTNQNGDIFAIPDRRLKPLVEKKFLPPDPPTQPPTTSEPITESVATATPEPAIQPQNSSPPPTYNPNQKFTVESPKLLPVVPLSIKKLFHKSMLYTKASLAIKSFLNLTPPKWTTESGNPNQDTFAVQRPRNNQEYQELISNPANSLELTKKFLDESQIPLLVVFFPHGHQLSPKAWSQGRLEHGFESGKTYSSQPQQDLINLINQKNITTVDLTPSFQSAKKPEDLYFKFDGHFTPEGHQFFTDALMSNLQFLSLIHD